MFYATVIHTGGAEQVLTSDEPITLRDLQDLVGGLIEVIGLGHGRSLVVNEEGCMRNLRVNTEASKLAGYGIVGPAVLLHYTLDR